MTLQTLPVNIGWLEVVCGPMFSGKTEELIRRVRRALYAKQKVQIFKPKLDTRYAEVEIVSHSKQRLTAIPVEKSEDILSQVDEDSEVVGIDEVQFFDREVVRVAQTLAHQNKRVICAGLDLDFRGVPFGPMPELLCVAEFVTKTLAICVVCGNPAGRSQRLVREQGRVVLGAIESYEPRCRAHHQVGEPQHSAQERLFV